MLELARSICMCGSLTRIPTILQRSNPLALWIPLLPRPLSLVLARQVIAEGCPDFLPAFDRVMKRCWGRRFNMFIMRREQFEAYSAWLFGILFELEKRLTAAEDPENSRVLGFVAERLLDVWLEKTQPRVRQVRVMHLESQHWPRKIATCLRRRFVPEERLRQKNKQTG